jgi:glutathione S-transferase
MPEYELVYFDIRGLAETTRWLFKVSKVAFKDTRLSLTFGTPGDFSTMKRPEFDELKAAGELDISLGKVPFLKVDGVKFGQSKAIERYVAKEVGMMGSTPLEALSIDQLASSIADVKDAYNAAKRTQGDEEKKAAIEKFFATDLPEWMGKIEKSVPAGSGPFLVGDKISYADLSYYMFLASPKGFFDNADGAKASFQACPRIKAAMEAVAENAELKAWIAERPDSMF